MFVRHSHCNGVYPRRQEVEAVVRFYQGLCQVAHRLKALDPFCMLLLEQASPQYHFYSCLDSCSNLLCSLTAHLHQVTVHADKAIMLFCMLLGPFQHARKHVTS